MPDPYHSLSEEAQRLVDTLTIMGFPRGRTARAVQNIGMDDKQVSSAEGCVPSYLAYIRHYCLYNVCSAVIGNPNP